MMKKSIAIGVALILMVAALGLFIIPATAANVTIPLSGRVSIELITSDASFRNTLSVFSPVASIAATGCKLEPANGLTGLHVLSEKLSQHGCRVDLDSDAATPGIQGFASNTTFEFRMCAQIDADPECEYVWSSNPNNNFDNFDHVQTTTLANGVYQLAWEDQENGGDQDFNDLIVVVRVQSDTDGDGLWDDWEQSGVDTNGDGNVDLDLPALGADPNRMDIFLEIDYLDCSEAGGDCVAGDTHSHEPKTAAVNAVIDAFANAPVTNPDGSTGITLHVDVDDAIPHQNFLSLGCEPGTGFDTIKVDPNYFGPSNPRRFTHHYMIFAHRQSATTTSSGCGERPGNDVIVTLGEWNTWCIGSGLNNTLDTTPAGDDVSANNIIYTGSNLTCDTTATGDDQQWTANGSSPTADRDGDGLDDRTVGTVQQQASTLIHELGHNLILRHGGDEATNYKPNYISIMNYAFQIPGIPPTDPDGTGPLSGRIDYSSVDLPDLNENNLNETTGIGNGTDNTRYYCPNGTQLLGSGTGAIDWNCDGDGGTDASVAVDINGDGNFSVLTGWNDWDNLKLDFQNSVNFEDGVHEILDTEKFEIPNYLSIVQEVEIDIHPFSYPNSINTKSKGVIPIAICNGGLVKNSVDIINPAISNSYGNASTNIDVSSIRFSMGSSGEPNHNLLDEIVLGDHLTQFTDTNNDLIPDTLVYLDAPDCSGGPVGPDLVVHIPVRDSGLTIGVVEACLTAELTDGTLVVGCDTVNIVK